jgi:hypothetical protein
VAALVVASAAVVSTPASAQDCFDHISTRNYTPWNCTAMPEIDRVFRMQTIVWNGHDYLFLDEGNEIKVFNIDSPQNPVVVAGSSFDVPNVGDSDYDLLSFSVCDDCRFGIANYKGATVLFDLGTGSTPVFGPFHENDQATQVKGGFTFKVGSQQYLVAASLGSFPCPGNDSGLYEFNGIDEAGNPRRQCLDGSDGPPQIANGIRIEGADPPVFYMADTFDRINIYRFRTSPTLGLDHLGNGGITRANMQRGTGIAFDEAAGLAAVASFGNLMIYDIGWDSGTPVAPVLLSTRDLTALPSANAVALRFPVVQVSTQYSAAPPLTFDVTTPTNPVPVDQGFWDPTQPPNNLGSCVWNNHTVFSDDGTAMYLSRYSAFQVIDPTGCSGPIQPVAGLNVSSQPVFPGDLVTVTNASVNGDRFATWITDGPSAHGDVILAGSTTLGAGSSLGYTLPVDMAASDVFWAHAAVETDNFPYVPGGTPDQLASVEIVVDRAPDAVIEIDPEAAITGDALTLTAVAEGHPSNPSGGSAYEWTVTDPSDGQTSTTGNPAAGIGVSEGGQWTFDLDVSYEHDRVGQPGVPYTRSVQLVRTISSVAAAFDVTPSSPMATQAISLNSTSRAAAGAALVFDWDVLSIQGALIHELAFCDDVGAVNDTCTIPPGTLAPGVVDVRLTLTNTAPVPDDVSVALVEDLEILDGYPLLSFVWAPTSPEIGQFTGFQITGVPADDVERAEWSFGGVGCDGSTGYTCVEPNFPGCDQAAFAYATGGLKTVGLTVTTTGGVQHPLVQRTLTVQYSGSCVGGPCTYALSPTLRAFASAGGDGSFTVSTQTGCAWSVFESASWIAITGGESGVGPGVVDYDVSANPGDARIASIVAGGKVHTVTQDALSPLVFTDGFESGDASAWVVAP